MLFITVGLALSGLLIAAFFLWRYPVTVAVVFIAAAVVSDLTDIGTEGIQLGILIYPLDLGCAALIAACIVVFLRTGSLSWDFCWPAMILFGMGLLNFIRGTFLFGLKAPGNDARNFIYLVLPVVAFTLLGNIVKIDVPRLVRSLSIASLILAFIALCKWAGVIPTSVDANDFREVVRVLSSDYAMIIGHALIGVLGIQLIRGFRITGVIIVGLFAGLVFALQHRSVWTATAAGLVWLTLCSPRLIRREWLKMSALVLLLASAFMLVPLIASGFLEKTLKLVHSNVEEVSQDGSTWAWRAEGYSEATERVLSNGLTEAALGPPSGRDLSDKASFASIHIHDRYISTLAYYGVIGLLILIVWLASTAGRIRRLPTQDRMARMDRVILEAMLVSALVYFVPYSGGQLEGSFLGAIWLASAARRDSTAAQHYRPTFATTSLAAERKAGFTWAEEDEASILWRKN